MTTAPDWKIIESRGREGLRSLEAEWRRLYARIPGRTYLVSYEACREYLDHCLEQPDAVRCLALSDGREVRAICLLEPRVERRLKIPVKVWGGLWLNHQTIHADLVGPEDEARRVFGPLLAEHLRRHPEGRRLLVLGPLEVDASLWEGLRRLDPADLCVDRNDRFRVLDCRRPYAQVEAACAKKLRRGLRNVRNRLAGLPDVAFRSARGPQALAEAVPAFLDLEASGWKGKAKSAIRDLRGGTGYYTGLALSLADDQDYGEIVSLYTGDHCIASLYTIRTGSTCSFPKIAYDQEYSRYSPGQLVLAHAIERCCADPGIERVNLVSDAAWVGGWPLEWVDLQMTFVNIGGPLGRLLVTLLRFRLGPLRRLARWLQSRLQRSGEHSNEE